MVGVEVSCRARGNKFCTFIVAHTSCIDEQINEFTGTSSEESKNQNKFIKGQFLKYFRTQKKSFLATSQIEKKARSRQNSLVASLAKINSQELKSLDTTFQLQKESENIFTELKCDPSYGKVCYGAEKFLILKASSLTKKIYSFLSQLDSVKSVVIGKERVTYFKLENKKSTQVRSC